MKNKKFLVTGGEGFIGSHLVTELSKNNDVTSFDIKSGKDILNYDLLKKEMKNVDYVFHLAALLDPNKEDVVKLIETNVVGTLNVLKASLENSVKKLVFASSAAVYGDSSRSHQTEDSPPRPVNFYAISKMSAENLILQFSKDYGLPVTIFRLFNVYGPGVEKVSQYSAVIPIFIENCLNKKSLTIYGDGEQTRDFIFIDDVIKILIESSKLKENVLMNVGSGENIPIKNLAKEIIDLTSSNSDILFAEPRPWDLKHSCADIMRLKRVLNYKPRYTLNDGLLETIKWFKRQN